MGRTLIAIVAAGALAGGTSALLALAAFSDHGVIATGDLQPSTLLQSASGGGASLATPPASPVSGDVAAPAGEAGPVAQPSQRSQPSGALAIHEVVTATPQPAAGGHVTVGVTAGPVVTATPAGAPSATPQRPGGVPVSTPSAAARSTLAATPTPVTPPAATPTPAPAAATPVPAPPAAPAPLCLLVICLRL
jgi:hypothetical protein